MSFVQTEGLSLALIRKTISVRMSLVETLEGCFAQPQLLSEVRANVRSQSRRCLCGTMRRTPGKILVPGVAEFRQEDGGINVPTGLLLRRDTAETPWLMRTATGYLFL